MEASSIAKLNPVSFLRVFLIQVFAREGSCHWPAILRLGVCISFLDFCFGGDVLVEGTVVVTLMLWFGGNLRPFVDIVVRSDFVNCFCIFECYGTDA